MEKLITNKMMNYIINNSISLHELEKSINKTVSREIEGNALSHIMNIMPMIIERFIDDKNSTLDTRIKDRVEVCDLVVDYLETLGYKAFHKPFYSDSNSIYTIYVSLNHWHIKKINRINMKKNNIKCKINI